MALISDKYEIVGKIGQGGMGAVYKVRHTQLDTLYALKLLPDHLADNPDLVARFQREARVMARLKHPNIVKVFDIARDGNLYYLVQEFIDGQNLAQYLRARKGLPVPEALEIARQIAVALAYAHGQGVVHRDIKPSNVLIEELIPVHAMLTDFGIAKVAQSSDHTETGMLLGSLKYAAPEQMGYRGRDRSTRLAIDARADVFAFGLVVFEMCEGREFFAGLEPHEILGRLVYEQDAFDPKFSRAVPDPIVSLIARAISRDPGDRQQSMADVLRELEGCLAAVLDPGDGPTQVLPRRPPSVAGDEVTDDELEGRIRALEAERQRRAAHAARAQLDAARERATAADAPAFARPLFDEARSVEERAAAALRDSQFLQAQDLFGEAAAAYGRAASAAADARARAAAEDARAAAAAARAAAEQMRAAEDASAVWDRARAAEERATAFMQDGAHADAAPAYDAARRLYEEAADVARRTAARRAADVARREMATARAAAVAADAEELAAAVVREAGDHAARGGAAFEAEDFGAAREAFEAAARCHRSAVDAAARERERRRIEEENRRRLRAAAVAEQERAERARADAEALAPARYAAGAHREAVAAMDAAERTLAAGDLEQAAPGFARAREAFTRAASAAREGQAREAAARARDEQRALAEAARTRARAAADAAAGVSGTGAAVDQKKRAVRLLADADRAFPADPGAADAAAFTRAAQLFEDAAAVFARAVAAAREEHRERVLALRADADASRSAAADAEPERYAPNEHAEAVDAVAAGERTLAAGDLDAAETAFTRAVTGFRDSARRAAEAREREAAAARAADEKRRRAEEAHAAEEARQRTKEARAAEEAQKREQEARAAEEARKRAEEARAAEEARKRAEEARAAEEARKRADEARAAEEARKRAEEARAAEEARKQAEEARAADQARRRAEEARAAEEARRQAEAAARDADEEATRVVRDEETRVLRDEATRVVRREKTPSSDQTVYVARKAGSARPSAEPTTPPGTATAGDAADAASAEPLFERPYEARPAPRLPVVPIGIAAAVVAAAVGWYVLSRAPEAPAPAPALAWRAVSPTQADVTVAEGDALAFSAEAAGGKGSVDYVWRVDGREAAHEPRWDFRPGYDEGGTTRAVAVVASSEGATIEKTWSVHVRNTNRPPTLESATPAGEIVNVAPGESPAFRVKAADPDAGEGDALTYVWERNGKRVPSVSEPSFTLRDPADNDEVRVTVTDRAGASAGSRTWKLALATPTKPATSPPRILASRPPPDAPVVVHEDATVDFSVQATGADRLRYAWFLDGASVGNAEKWRFTAPATEADASHRVEVEVSDAAGQTAPRVAWNVDVKLRAPEIADVSPAAGSVTVDAGQAREFSVRTHGFGRGGTVRKEWEIDGHAVSGGPDRLALPTDLAAGRHAVTVTAVDARGLRSAPQRWTVDVHEALAAKPPPPTIPPAPTSAPPPAARADGALSEADVRGWLARFTDAWHRKDVGALRALGVIASDDQERALRDALKQYNDYRVAISNETIQIQGNRGTVSFDRVDSDETGKKLAHPRQTYRLEKVDGAVVVTKR